MDEHSLYEIARTRVQVRSRRRLLWYINLVGFLMYIGLLILLTSTTLILPAVFVLMVWIALFVLHTFVVEQQEAHQKDIEAEIAHLQIEFRLPNLKTDGLDQLPGGVNQNGGSRSTSHDWLLPEPLSAREMEVLALLATGASNHEIAQQLVIAPNTVKRHVKHILAKLQATNRTQAVHHARELHLL